MAAISIAASATGAASALPGGSLVRTRALAPNGWAATSTLAIPLTQAPDLGAMPAASPLRIVVALKGDRAGANALLKHIYTPGDPLYHQFLTPAQFTARFAPSAAAASAVASYLSGVGMTNVKVAPNRLLVTADSTVGIASSAFDTAIHATRQGSHAAFVNVAPAMVPAALGGTVQSVLGLTNLQLRTFKSQMPAAARARFFHTKHFAHKSFARTRMDGTPPAECNQNGGLITGLIGGEVGITIPTFLPNATLPFCYPAAFTPNAYRVAYNDQANPTAGSTSIADFTEGATNLPYGQGSLTDVVSDLFQMEYVNGIPQAPVTIVPVGDQSTDTSGQIEWDIDSQAAAGIAGGVKHYYFYNAYDLSTGSENEMFNQFATDDVAQVGNASFGGCEFGQYLEGGLTSTDMILAETALQGQTVTVSSGDSASQCEFLFGSNGLPAGVPSVQYPASSPYVLAVGGTSLLANATSGGYYSEVTWCGLSCGGGGGISYFEQQSPWQGQMIADLAEQGFTAGNRLVPDMAMNADPYTGIIIYISGVETPGWGGTSLAAPLAEGVYARLMTRHGNALGNAAASQYPPYLANGGGLGIGLSGSMSFPVPSGLTPAVIGQFNDVFLGTNTLYQATPGFDLNTGMGSFNIDSLFVLWGS